MRNNLCRMSKITVLIAITITVVIVTIVAGLVVTFVLQKSKLPKFDLKKFLQNRFEKDATEMCTKLKKADWDASTDTANATKRKIYEKVQVEHDVFIYTYWRSYFKDANPSDYKDEHVKRQIKLLKRIGVLALERAKLNELNALKADMLNVYTKGKICPRNVTQCDLEKEGLSLTPEIEEILTSANYSELVYVWTAWRNVFGPDVKDMYRKYVDLSNEAAAANDMNDYTELYLSRYESSTLIVDIDDLWLQVEPLYRELHKYVGKKLKELYGDELDISDGLIPAHVFGDMGARNWEHLSDLVEPFPNATKVDGDRALKDAQFTVIKMFDEANEFYKSMGLLPNDICYNTGAGAIIEKPTNRKRMSCEASAWDFCDGKNYRIKMCAQPSIEDFYEIHSKMGEIQYFLQYAKKPYAFRTAANPSFFAAVGDTITLSVITPKHLHRIGILKNDINDTESHSISINALMTTALRKIALLPFSLAVDKWRCDVFSGKISDHRWNARWWKYKKKYQKLKPPKDTSETNLDPAADFHVAADPSYTEYFLSHILQFQLFKSLCIAADEYDPKNRAKPLFECDFHGSKKAAKVLSLALVSIGAMSWKL